MIKLKYFATMFAILPTLSLTSCGLSSNNNTIVFAMKTGGIVQSAKDFVNQVKLNFDKLTENLELKNLPTTFKVKEVSDNSSKKTLIENGSANFAFLTVNSVLDNNFYKNTKPLIQTLTTPFTFDLDENQKYVDEAISKDGAASDPLIEIAKEMQKASFGSNYEYPFNTWKDGKGGQPNYDWNSIRYNAFYDTKSEPVKFYRGMIVLSGTKTENEKIKEAWNSKNWDAFRNYGIVLGESSSNGNYKLQEQLIKKHFSQLYWTLDSDRASNPDKYKTNSSGTDMRDKNYRIHFTDEASFAWTKNTESNLDFYYPRNDNVVEILTVTNPSLYDIGTFSKNVDDQVAKYISEAIVQTYKENKNNYGESLGYNGYKKIDDFKIEVIDYLEK